ncbi:MAG: LPS assembly lipoprotein LptE [Alphaproteobacteria bacterium]|nr:LPS assembly lipoprotein LptE [Alphaproteobacteria bacterium]
MSWHKVIAASGVAVMVLSATSCGFKPLYGDHASSVSQASLAQVRLPPLRDRVGQLLHIRLSKGMHPRGKPRNPVWDLVIKLTTRTENLGIRKDETATRANLTLEARFELRQIATGRVSFKGRSVITISYNILESRFSTLASRTDATRRATRELADNIKTRVALFLSQRGAVRVPKMPAGGTPKQVPAP